ncbi:hypothetical protein [Okeania sp.]|uniref:hypothetical protein n=1 Tax=Okeania sp. TaxID=3100323 RepID=UPI002B4B7247|nr:hypothetical protein [Okeania sp.]MEB3340328.1 hypothetical protein [Okeania sp.]
MQGFRLVGDRYQKAELIQGRLLVPEIELSLGLWQGSFNSVSRLWLRWMTWEGDLIPTLEEKEAAAKLEATLAKEKEAVAEQRATDAEQRATNAEQQKERLAAKLRELGIDPDEI